MNKTLVGIDYLLEVEWRINVVSKWGFAIEVSIEAFNLFDGGIALYNLGGKNASRKVATIGNKVYFALKSGLQLTQRLFDFGNMLVLKSLVDTHVVKIGRAHV